MSKKCGNKEMKSTNSNEKINSEYKWFPDNSLAVERDNVCSIRTIEILAEYNETTLMGYQCNLANLFCYTNESIIVWNNNSIL